MHEDVITLSASPIRRLIAVGLLAALGGLCVLLALTSASQSVFGMIFLLSLGAFALFGAERLRRATLVSIILNATQICESNGRVLCELSNIRAVERGAFAFKPSNGFLVRMKTPMPFVYAPGLWWRIGKMVGIGGVVPGSEAKFMSELLAMKISEQSEE